jgi:hypothetical protein
MPHSAGIALHPNDREMHYSAFVSEGNLVGSEELAIGSSPVLHEASVPGLGCHSRLLS